MLTKLILSGALAFAIASPTLAGEGSPDIDVPAGNAAPWNPETTAPAGYGSQSFRFDSDVRGALAFEPRQTPRMYTPQERAYYYRGTSDGI